MDPTPKHGKRSSDRKRQSPSFYGFELSSDSAIIAPPERTRRAGDVENYQSPPESIVETVQHIADQQPDETILSPIMGHVSPPNLQNPSLLDTDTPTLVHSMMVFEAKNQEKMYE